MSNLFVKFNNTNATIPNNFDNNSINQNNNTIYPYALGAGCDSYPIRVSIPSSALIGASGIAFRIGGVGGGCCIGESGPLYSNIVKIPILGNTYAPFEGRSSVLLNGVAVTSQYTGDVQLSNNTEWSACDGLLSGNHLLLGSSGPFVYTMYFNQNIQTLRLRLSGGGVVGGLGTESFTFTTNGPGAAPYVTFAGYGTPSSYPIIGPCSCTIGGNVAYIQNAGGATFEIYTNSEAGAGGAPFTQLTISGNGGFGGTMLVLDSLTVFGGS